MDMTNLSRKYALALFSHYGWFKNSFEWMCKLSELIKFVRIYQHYFKYKPAQKYALVLHDINLFDGNVEYIIALLEKDHRIILMPDILEEVLNLYKDYHGIENCKIMSACALTDAQKHMLEHDLVRKVHKKLLYTYEIDSSLIAGVRVRGENFIYEDSVAQKLQKLKQASNGSCAIMVV